MKRSVWLFALLIGAIAVAFLVFAPMGASVSSASRLQVSPTPTVPGGIGVEPENPTPTPLLPGLKTPAPDDRFGTGPRVTPPPTLDELLAQFPDLAPYIESVKDLQIGEMDLAELYKRIFEIYEKEGATGIAVFLKESGILDKMGVPLSYLDFLIAFDKGGFPEVEALARARKLINVDDELVVYLAIEDPETNLQTVQETLINSYGVTVYELEPNNDELEIGIPLVVLGAYQTPGTLLAYLTGIANIEHVVGVRLPSPPLTGSLGLQGRGSPIARTIGADVWHAAGFTGKGVKIAVMDLGFGGISELLGSELPANVKSNVPLATLNRQQENHGTAVATVMHRVAPDAELHLVYLDPASNTSFSKGLQWMEDQGVQVVNYSVSSIIGPRDGTSSDAQLVELFMRRTGALWVNSSGNYAQSHTLFQFNPGEKGIHFFSEDRNLLPFITYAPFTSIGMNWNGNWRGGERNEYILVVLDSEGNEVAAATEQRRGKKNAFPFQFLSFESTPGEIYYMLIARTFGRTNNVIDIIAPNTEFAPWAIVPTYSLATPADAASVLTVGATDLSGTEIESYSSQGPTQDDRLKPDVSAPTNEIVPGYDRGFSGTSGAAPVAAGAAALVRQAFPDFSAAEVKAYLMANVMDFGESGEDVVYGAGRIMLPPPEGVDPTRGNVGGNEPPLTNDNISATVDDVSAKFNVRSQGKTGMSIAIDVTVNNAAGRQLVVGAIFTDENDGPVPSADPEFDVNGTIGVATLVKVTGKQNRFKDITLFIPNAVFSDLPAGRIKFTVVVLDATDENNIERLAIAEPVFLRISKN
ncbi:MAG: hypothetical protein OHK0023_04970 [Anaerolineae bacterium]